VIGRLAHALWTRSPSDLAAALQRRVRRRPGAAPAGATAASGYHQWLLGEFHAYIAATYPDTALPRERFVQLIGEYQDRDWIKRTNRYIGDLWYLFAPDFAQRLPDYYRYTDLQLTLTLLSYATSESLLNTNYLRPYRLARQRLGQFSVLELGAGIPHGLLHTVYKEGPTFCTALTSVDIDGVPARFLEFFCRRHHINHRWIMAIAGQATPLGAIGRFDFIFAKDVFEHLHDPEPAVDDVLRCASNRALLALDLDDKGAVVYQHVSPALGPLRDAVRSAGFELVEQTGNMSIYESRRRS
jgi:SAM-dependent methyltransferase